MICAERCIAHQCWKAQSHVRLDEINPGQWFAKQLKDKLGAEKVLVIGFDGMDPQLVAVIESGAARDPFAAQFAEGAANRLVELLDTIDQERATFFARQTALARFDPELAQVFFLQSDDESVRARLQSSRLWNLSNSSASIALASQSVGGFQTSGRLGG